VICHTAGTTTTAPGSGCCDATTRSAKCGWFEIDPCYVFHVANAYDQGNSIVLQAVRYPELWRDTGGFETDGMLWSWNIDLQTGTVSERQLDDRVVEFPRIDDRLATMPARYGVAVGEGSLVRYDLTTGDAVEHRFGTAESPGGPGEAVCSYRQPQALPTRAAAGISVTFTTRHAMAATW